MGYGAVRDDKTKGPASLGNESRCKLATQDMLSLRQAWVLFSMNPSTGSGGTCFGDSGGPHFLGAGSSETRIVVVLTVTGDRYCRATDQTLSARHAAARESVPRRLPEAPGNRAVPRVESPASCARSPLAHAPRSAVFAATQGSSPRTSSMKRSASSRRIDP